MLRGDSPIAGEGGFLTSVDQNSSLTFLYWWQGVRGRAFVLFLLFLPLLLLPLLWIDDEIDDEDYLMIFVHVPAARRLRCPTHIRR